MRNIYDPYLSNPDILMKNNSSNISFEISKNKNIESSMKVLGKNLTDRNNPTNRAKVTSPTQYYMKNFDNLKQSFSMKSSFSRKDERKNSMVEFKGNRHSSIDSD